ncbi:hypothetical protein OAP06_04485 [Gammaproteobacteria bacterium]|nr:hypothetical protein [Gammaproteobacteria bacterium]
MNQNNSPNLVILSVPFIRIARTLLSREVLTLFSAKADILIVSPFSSEAGFIEDFQKENTTLYTWKQKKCSYLTQKILVITELMRRNGYWFRYRNSGMEFFYKNQYTVFGNEGKDHKLNVIKRLFLYFLGFFGQSNKAWSITENLLGKSWYQDKRLLEISRRYENIALIQSANWGIQDRELAHLSIDENWRKILVTYSTDQLFCNGHLLNSFDSICVQGPFEYKQARDFHKIPESKIYKLGSLWLRHLEEIKRNQASVLKTDDKKKTTIVYAGVSSDYYSLSDELEAVDSILNYIDKMESEVKLKYRPVISDIKTKKKIEEKYESISSIELVWPQNLFISIDKYGERGFRDSILQFIQDCKGCDLFIMSYSTSLGIEMAFLEKCAVISNMLDTKEMLKKRHHKYFRMDYFKGVPITYSIEDLLKKVHLYLHDNKASQKLANQIVSEWDYPNKNFGNTLLKAVFD